MTAALLLLLSTTAMTAPPTGKVLAVMTLQAKGGVPPEALGLISDHLAEQLQGKPPWERVLNPQDVAVLMPDAQQQQIVECALDACVLVDLEMAGGLGATHLLAGSLGKVGTDYLLSLKLFELRSASVIASLSERVPGASDEKVLDALPNAAALIMQRSGLVAAPVRVKSASPSWAVPGSIALVSGLLGAVVTTMVLSAAAVWLGVVFGSADALLRIPRIGPTQDTAVLGRMFGPPLLLVSLATVIAIVSAGLVVAGVAGVVRP